MDVCLLWGRGLCDGPITRPDESCGLWCVYLECCRGTSKRRYRRTGAVEPWKVHGTSLRRHVRRFSDFIRVGWSGDRIPVAARFSAPVQTSPEAHQGSCTMGTGSLPGWKRPGLGINSPPHLATRLRKGRPIPVLPPWALMACSILKLPVLIHFLETMSSVLTFKGV